MTSGNTFFYTYSVVLYIVPINGKTVDTYVHVFVHTGRLLSLSNQAETGSEETEVKLFNF